MSSVLLQERTGRVLRLTINRPEKLNSLSPEVLFDLGDALRELSGSDEVRCAVLEGAGGRAFSSGYDISRIPDGREAERGNPLEYGLRAVMDFPYPVIAAVRGFAMGAGFHLALACDLRIASEDALFSMPPVKLGVVYPAEGYDLFVRVLGAAAARAIFLTGRRFTAEEALRMGLVLQVEPPDRLDAVVSELAREIADENAPLAVKGAKFVLNRLQAGDLQPGDADEARRLMVQAFQSEDAREARAAFAEKRKPEFKGR